MAIGEDRTRARAAEGAGDQGAAVEAAIDTEREQIAGGADDEADDDDDDFLRRVARVADIVPQVDGRRTTASHLSLPLDLGDKYRLETRVGEGGMGAVYGAVHRATGKQVAIKVLHPCHSHKSKMVERFLREAEAAARINHPNVVDIYDVGNHDGLSFLVMERLFGESLAARLGRGPLDVDETIHLLMPALRGLFAAHARGIVHRDLKPDNIFLPRTPDGAPYEAKILDFGVSRLATTGARPAGPRLTTDGVVLGTPAYMSPEQLNHGGDVDERSDIYSMGVIVYQCLCGQPPFASPTYAELLSRICRSEYQPLHERAPEVPVALAAAVERAMHVERERRFPSVAAFARALEPFGPGTVFRPGTYPPHMRGMSRAPAAAGSGRVPVQAAVVPEQPASASETERQPAVRAVMSGRGRAMALLLATAASAGALWWLMRGG